jgi:hypothetical protein
VRRVASRLRPPILIAAICSHLPRASGSKFVGTSTVLKLSPPGTGENAAERTGGGSASIEVLDCLGKTEESVLFVTIP